MDNEERVQGEEKNVKVDVVHKGQKQSVVQIMDGTVVVRYVVKNSLVKSGKVAERELKNTYGLKFSDFLKSVPSIEDIENVFHANGLWTAEDVRKKPQSVIAALGSAYAPVLKSLMQYIKKQKI